MDANKLDKLREIEYEIRPACGTCLRSSFRAGSDFGICNHHSYGHLKHSEPESPLSVHYLGCCGDFTVDGAVAAKLGAWVEFVVNP